LFFRIGISANIKQSFILYFLSEFATNDICTKLFPKTRLTNFYAKTKLSCKQDAKKNIQYAKIILRRRCVFDVPTLKQISVKINIQDGTSQPKGLCDFGLGFSGFCGSDKRSQKTKTESPR
jgi:hypothetical protein